MLFWNIFTKNKGFSQKIGNAYFNILKKIEYSEFRFDIK